jgi:hypothetical protein
MAAVPDPSNTATSILAAEVKRPVSPSLWARMMTRFENGDGGRIAHGVSSMAVLKASFRLVLRTATMADVDDDRRHPISS